MNARVYRIAGAAAIATLLLGLVGCTAPGGGGGGGGSGGAANDNALANQPGDVPNQNATAAPPNANSADGMQGNVNASPPANMNASAGTGQPNANSDPTPPVNENGAVAPPNSNSSDNANSDDADNSNGSGTVTEQSVTIEPDDHPDGTELTGVSPLFELHTALDDNSIAGLFEVTASDDGQGLAPTGEQVFGHEDIPFFNDNRRLRIDFESPAREVSVLFGGGTFFETEIGRLQAYDVGDNLIAEYSTSPMGAGETEEMFIRRETFDIAWVVAYSEGGGSFGRLDALTVTVRTAP